LSVSFAIFSWQFFQASGYFPAALSRYGDRLGAGGMAADNRHLSFFYVEKICKHPDAFFICLAIYRGRRYPELEGIILNASKLRTGCPRHDPDMEKNAVFGFT